MGAVGVGVGSGSAVPPRAVMLMKFCAVAGSDVAPIASNVAT